MVQTQLKSTPAKGVPGGRVDCGLDYRIDSKFVEGAAIPPGVWSLRGTDGKRQMRLPSAAIIADVDAFKTTFASATSARTFTGSDFNGVVGQGALAVPARVTLVLNSDADWLAGAAILRGEDELGNELFETLLIPSGGNATLTSVHLYSKVTSLYLPAGDGTEGSATLGNAASYTVDMTEVCGVVAYEDLREYHRLATNPGYFLGGECAGVFRKGRVYVISETAARAGDPVYMRVIAAGNQQAGATRNAADSSNTLDLSSVARYAEDCAANSLAAIELNLP